jgi:hypothetical protein
LSEAVIEREYREHRAAVLAMLAAQFPRLGDPAELYQDAWAELLELERRGEHVRHHRALLKTIAWRRAADTIKQRRRVVSVDPAGLVLENVADARALPDEEAQRHLDGEALRLVVESLDEREAEMMASRMQAHELGQRQRRVGHPSTAHKHRQRPSHQRVAQRRGGARFRLWLIGQRAPCRRVAVAGLGHPLAHGLLERGVASHKQRSRSRGPAHHDRRWS